MGKKRDEVDGELNITSMMDMMTIILVFLLKSVGSSEVEVRTSDTLKLPYTTSVIGCYVLSNDTVVDHRGSFLVKHTTSSTTCSCA